MKLFVIVYLHLLRRYCGKFGLASSLHGVRTASSSRSSVTRKPFWQPCGFQTFQRKKNCLASPLLRVMLPQLIPSCCALTTESYRPICPWVVVQRMEVTHGQPSNPASPSTAHRNVVHCQFALQRCSHTSCCRLGSQLLSQLPKYCQADFKGLELTQGKDSVSVMILQRPEPALWFFFFFFNVRVYFCKSPDMDEFLISKFNVRFKSLQCFHDPSGVMNTPHPPPHTHFNTHFALTCS